MGRTGSRPEKGVLGEQEQARAEALADSLCPFDPDGPPALERFVDELRRLLGAGMGLSLGSGATSDGFELTFGHTAGPLVPPDFLAHVDTWMHRSPSRWALWDPTRPEPRQRNAVVNVGRYLDLMQKEADLRGFGVSREAVEVARERLARAERLQGVAWLVRQHQLRSLICDGPDLLAWVGLVDSAPFGPREIALFERLIPALQRRLSLERRLRDAAVHAGGFVTALDALASPAFLIDGAGAIRHANLTGRSWLERDRAALLELLRRSAKGEPAGFRLTPLAADGMPRHLLAIWERPVPDAQHRVDTFAARYRLTPRERDVLAHLTRGESNKQIATALGCAEKTVELHVTHLLRKTGAASRSDLTATFWSDPAGEPLIHPVH